MLYLVPQFRLNLEFGNEKKAAVPHYLLHDILSSFRMGVTEVKIVNNERLNSEPQRFGEIIAACQQNIKTSVQNLSSTMSKCLMRS
jgi:hypothetical protein